MLAIGAAIMLGACGTAHAGNKYAIILQAGTKSHEGSARAVHAFLYAQELQEHGHKVVLIFDGAGTQWAAALSDPNGNSPLKPAYEQFKATGTVEIICEYCAGAFGVKDTLAERGTTLVSEYAGHPSIAKWVDQGYQLLIL